MYPIIGQGKLSTVKVHPIHIGDVILDVNLVQILLFLVLFCSV